MGHSFAASDHIGSQRTVHLSWDENTEEDLAGYRLYYGEESGEYEKVVEVGNQTTLTLRGLDPETDYYFVVTAYDVNQQESRPSNEVFSKGKKGDKTPPVISDVHVEEITTSSTIITWTTNEPTKGSLDYGTTAAFDHTFYSSETATVHRAILKGLAAATYFYRITAVDAAGNKATRSDAAFSFTTAPAQIPLAIYSIRVQPIKRSPRHALVVWETNRPATSRVEYGATTAYGKVSQMKSPLRTRHARVMRNLRSGRIFYFRIVSEDAGGNVAAAAEKFEIALRDGKPVIRR